MRTTAALAVAALTAGLAAQGVVEVGAKPNFEFKQGLLNGRGAGSLADLRGVPTIVEFWGTR